MLELPETVWDYVAWMVFDVAQARKWLLSDFYQLISLRPLPPSEVDEAPMWHFILGMGFRLPPIGGCLSRVIQVFVQNHMGDTLRFFRDMVMAAGADIRAISLAFSLLQGPSTTTGAQSNGV